MRPIVVIAYDVTGRVVPMSEIRVRALPRRFGYFDGFEVSGIPYEDSSGLRRGWQLHGKPDGNRKTDHPF
jgi:hypothetical protein